LFGSWLHGLHPKLIKNQIMLEATALCWAIWLNRKDMAFNQANSNTFLHRAMMFWIRQWPMLHRKEDQLLLKMGYTSWESLILAAFAKYGWCFRNGIAD
jgi:hypothetical protein